MRCTIAEINANNLRHNINIIQAQAGGAAICAMIKANAYGHGAVACSKILREEGVEYLGVAFIDEAVELRKSGDNGSILVLVAAKPEDAGDFINYNIETAFSTFETLESFAKIAKDKGAIVRGHLFIDSGMRRDGVKPDKALEFMQLASTFDSIKIVGICTHLATADDDKDFANQQLLEFNNCVEALESRGYSFKYIHSLNSAGMTNLNPGKFNMCRCGISVYGLMSNKALADKMNLKPILELKSAVQLVKSVKKGEQVGYSKRFIAEADTRIIVIPVGYGDGYFRNLTNKSKVIINGRMFNLIGTICMDNCMAEIGDADVKPGDEAIFIGERGEHSITAYDLANIIGTIPYEITTSITQRVPRVIK